MLRMVRGFGCIIGVALALGTTPSVAAEPWLQLKGTPGCAPSSEQVAARVIEQVIGEPNAQLRARVELSQSEQGTVAEIRLFRANETLGQRHLVAASCDQAVEAVVALVALALSAPSTTGGAELEEGRQSSVAAEPTAAPEPAQPEDTRSPELLGPSASSQWALTVSGGHDVGSFGTQLLLLSAGLRRAFASSELRASLWYGPGSRDESSAPERMEQQSTDFGGLVLDYCLGLDAGRWVSACGGVELGVVRSSFRSEEPQGGVADVDELDASLRSALGVLMVYRGTWVQPELLVSGRVLTAGGSPGAEILGLRTTLGAAIAF